MVMTMHLQTMQQSKKRLELLMGQDLEKTTLPFAGCTREFIMKWSVSRPSVAIVFLSIHPRFSSSFWW